MYCPKCSQQQSSDEMRFCPRCGFALAGVAMLMDNDGVIPGPDGPSVQTLPSSRKKIMAESAIFTAVTWLVAMVATFWFDFGGPFEVVAKVAALLFFILGLIGLLRFLYGFLFANDVVVQPGSALGNLASRAAMAETRRPQSLPAQRDLAATDYPRRTNTKEMTPQSSVTEHTTRLLEEPPADRGD
jgi:hypothetical protein